MPQIQINANVLAHIDVLLGFAKTSEEHRYVRPVVDGSDVIDLKQASPPCDRNTIAYWRKLCAKRYLPG